MTWNSPTVHTGATAIASSLELDPRKRPVRAT
jgi:hypothetical protein